MSPIMELLYDYWIGPSDSEKWPDHIKDKPAEGQGRYAFEEGLLLGLALGAELYKRETP